MFRKLIAYAFVVLVFALVATGCGSAPGSAPASNVVAPAPSAAPAVSNPTATSAPAPVNVPAQSTTASGASNSAAAGIIKLDIVSDKSQAQYRVREQLAQVSLPSDAIGKTNAISGSIVGKPDGTILSDQSKFVVDMRTLQSDRSSRDNFLRGQILQTNKYPTATFVPTSATGLPATFPPTGPVSFKLTGDMTILSTTKPLTWDVNCDAPTDGGGQGVCHATTSFKFEDFGIPQPRVPVVLSVVDNITLELDLTLQRAG